MTIATSETREAISPARIDELLAPLARAKSLLLAVSGGPDSTALLIMAADWAGRAGRPRIEVATVDHGMRPQSRAEAEAVGALARRFGLDHHLIEWLEPKPRSRIQERAREARYRLLNECARKIGADFIVTAHHADDQAETVIFRLLRGSGIAGLRGMESFAAQGELTLARPFLGLRKAELVAHCKAWGEPFSHDPSNADPRFARTHLRGLIETLAAEGLDVSQIVRLARRAGRMEDAVAAQVEASAHGLGWTSARETRDAIALFDEPTEVVQRLLTREIVRVAGKAPRQLRLDRIEALAEMLQQGLARNKAVRANIGGASVQMSAEGVLSVSPEKPRRALSPGVHGSRGEPRNDGVA